MRRGLKKQMALSWTRGATRKRHQVAGLVAKGEQEWHHAVIPHGGWGKHVPDQIKNASWNLKALEQETHRRIHGVFNELPGFNPVKRTWIGTPDHIKAGAAAVTGHGINAASHHVVERRHGR